ncbi:methionyl-tRNA formyltransferase [bacterium]|nr:MAG: methionyl-tRNA formyltransferase [bacterium]
MTPYKMKIIFFGSSHFAVSSLKALSAEGHNVLCVVTQPDKKKGRGLHFGPTLVKQEAQARGLQIYQPTQINTPECADFLKAFNADLFVVIAYGQILSKEILSIPLNFCINIHASMLPAYRGAAPINWAIINGEKATGISIIKLSEKMDAGPVIMQKSFPIHDNDSFTSLEQRLADSGAELLIESIKSIIKQDYKLIPQDKNKISFAPKLKKSDGLIKWERPAQEINNLVRGALAWPFAFTYYKGKILKIYESSVLAGEGFSPGVIMDISKNGITVSTGKGSFLIKELQLEGKRHMHAEEFIAGHKLSIGEKLGK